MTADTVIAGAGLAGAAAALALAPSRRVVVLDSGAPGASAAAAGLVNPFLGRKAKRAWRADEALRALGGLLERAGAPGLWRRTGLLRPAQAPAQAEAFHQRQAEHPDLLEWVRPEASAERFPHVRAPHGALWVREGGHADVGAVARAALHAALREGAVVLRRKLTGWRAGVARTDAGNIRARHLLLCTGAGMPPLAPRLPLHRVKGQTLCVRPARPLASVPVSGGAYAVPAADGTWTLGATFEHAYATESPTPEADVWLRERIAGVVPALADAALVERRAGVRLTVPAAARPHGAGRLPLVGPLAWAPGAAPEAGGLSVWAFGALGAKGLLTAPLLARHLPTWLNAPEAIPPEVSTAALRTR